MVLAENRQFHKFIILTIILPFPHDSATHNQHLHFESPCALLMVNPSNESHTRAARDVVMASHASIAQSTIALKVFREAPSLELFLLRRLLFLPFVLCIIDRIRRRHLTPRRHFLNRRSQQPFRSQRSNQTESAPRQTNSAHAFRARQRLRETVRTRRWPRRAAP